MIQDLPPPSYQEGRMYGLDGGLLNRLIKAIQARTLIAGTAIQLKELPTGVLVSATAEAVTQGAYCPFGEITTYELTGSTKTGIRGGIIHCGDKNFEVPNQTLNLSTEGDWLVWIEVTCTSNRDDDNEIFLPGIETGTAPSGTWSRTPWSASASYPDNDPPSVSSGTGKIILPVGRLTIDGGTATLIPAGCGNFRIAQCAGSLSYTRA